MSVHASIGGGERSGRGYRVEKGPGTARASPFPSTDAAAVSAVDLVGIDRVLRTFYGALSGAAPERRWHQFRALFERGSWMRCADGFEIPIEQYVEQEREAERPTTVIEMDRAIRVDGALAFVASAYRAFDEDGGAVLGVNEFLLRKAEARWRIAGTTTDQRDARGRREPLRSR
jgi:hypothetical protein